MFIELFCIIKNNFIAQVRENGEQIFTKTKNYVRAWKVDGHHP